jgi:hypothetical protein
LVGKTNYREKMKEGLGQEEEGIKNPPLSENKIKS